MNLKNKIRVGIPLSGKMAFRTFHGSAFLHKMRDAYIEPVYMLNSDSSEGNREDGVSYAAIPELPEPKRLDVEWIGPFRRFVARTETTELHFRALIARCVEDNRHLGRTLLYSFALYLLRYMSCFAAPSVRVSERRLSSLEIRKFLEDLKLDALLVPGIGSYGFDYANVIVCEAQRLGLSVISGISNYDNICSRGYRGYMPDAVAVWSELMKDDITRINGIPPSRVAVIGPVQFDRYCGEVEVPRDLYLSSIGLDPKCKTVLYAGSTNTLDLLHYMKLLINETKKCCGDAFNIIIRPHPDPRLMKSPAIWACSELAKAWGARVYVSDPASEGGRQEGVPCVVDELHALLKYSDVLINHYSTLGLEAAICDLPTIYLGYDNFAHGFSAKSTARWYASTTHNLRSARLLAGRVVKNDKDLISNVIEYAGNRAIQSTERKRYAEMECSTLDGGATTRLAGLIRKVLGRNGYDAEQDW